MAAPLTLNAWLRYDAVSRLLHEVNGQTLLEIGSGTGSLGLVLAQRFVYTGVEPDQASHAIALERFRAASVPGDVINSGVEELGDAAFDIVCAFEVLEHIEDDTAALRHWRRHLRPGGTLLISVPAGRQRFGASDEKVGHFRRYDRDDLRRVLIEAGFVDVKVLTYGFPIGYVLHFAWNVLAAMRPDRSTPAERSGASGRWMQPSDRFAWTRRLISAPFRLMQRPFAPTTLGTGIVALARRNDRAT